MRNVAIQVAHGEAPATTQDRQTKGPVLVIAGEVSGDKHAAKLVQELNRLNPELEIYAAGGERMERAGARLLYNLVDMAVLGSVEVLKNYFKLRRIFYGLLKFVEQKRCEAVILVDYPGFNIRFAKELRKRGSRVRVIYYISPQVWAWGMRRKKIIDKNIDKMVVILPFEEEFYKHCSFPVDYVGHPILDDLKVETPPEQLRERYDLCRDSQLVSLLPGSRWNEVRRHLPIMLSSAKLMSEARPELEFALLEPQPGFRGFVDNALKRSPVDVKVVRGNMYDLINASRIVLVASGTATLETACLLKPMLIIYRVAWPTYFLGRMLIKMPYIGLVNVIAGKKIVPEFIQQDAKPARIAATALDLLGSEDRYMKAIDALKLLCDSLGEPGASARAANIVIEELGGGK